MMNFFDIAFNQFLNYRLGSANLHRHNNCQFYGILPPHSTELKSKVELSGDLILGANIPVAESSTIRLCVISDTHERHSALTSLPLSCDILIHAGDILMTSRFVSKNEAVRKLKSFNEWLGIQQIKHKIVVAGNHDKVLEQLSPAEIGEILTNATYLCNSSTHVLGLHIWGTPHSRGRSSNSAFQSEEFAQVTEQAVRSLCGSCEDRAVDILVTHGTCREIAAMIQPRVAHISGHLHAMHGVYQLPSPPSAKGTPAWLTIAAPIMNAKYEPRQAPIVVDLVTPVVPTLECG